MTTSQNMIKNSKINSKLASDFASRLLVWFEEFGRHDLPWQFHHQDHADIYAVWLSEVMLQQTQVATVLGYFERFLAKFPTVQDLAMGEWDDVAALWAGLGYYARARNLHTGAKQVADFIEKTGDFPQTIDEWQSIKGVGRSTAGAIVAMGVRSFGVICDGNVKRVLTRHRAIDGDITKSTTDKALWQLATALTPDVDSGKYAQAMMDLGATICTRNKPKCDICPVAIDCQARLLGKQTAYPVKKKPAPKPHRHSLAVALQYQDRTLWLQRHNDGGIWDGLWCLPMMPLASDADTILGQAMLNQLMSQAEQTPLAEQVLFDVLGAIQHLPVQHHIKHTLTHFHWHIYLVTLKVDERLYQLLNQSLQSVHADFVWGDGKHLAKPVAMDRLMTKKA